MNRIPFSNDHFLIEIKNFIILKKNAFLWDDPFTVDAGSEDQIDDSRYIRSGLSGAGESVKLKPIRKRPLHSGGDLGKH